MDDPEAALNASLADLRHWYLAPTSPGQLAGAGVPFAITTDGLSSINDFLPNLRIAVARGLSEDDALAALTTTPASWLGIDRTHGTIEAGTGRPKGATASGASAHALAGHAFARGDAAR